jgi:hypothetical protein
MLTLIAALALAAAPAPTLDALAERYVHLSLEAGEREPGYVDAYYGPPAWATAAKASPRTVAELRAEATALSKALAAYPTAALAPDQRRRRTFLIGQVRAAETRLAMNAGQKFSFADEAEGLFGVRPVLRPLASYDPILAGLERIAPGPGPLAARVDALLDRYVVPRDRLEPVMRTAIAECRARTVRHIALPANEKFDLEFVTGKSWSGYNWYKGNAHSLIQVNTDLPVRLNRAVDLGCHEGYPGHHALNMLLEQRLAKGKGWVEFTVYPLFGPQSLIAEGTANYGIHLSFPGKEQEAFERTTLFPLAGLDPATAPRLAAIRTAMEALAGARLTIAEMYLDGRIDRAKAVELAQRYQLLSKARAEQSVAFTDTYRSYVINYGLGQDMARTKVERAGADQAARWAVFERLISEPTTPADLAD